MAASPITWPASPCSPSPERAGTPPAHSELQSHLLEAVALRSASDRIAAESSRPLSGPAPPTGGHTVSRRAPARRTRSRGVVLALAVVAVSALVASSCGGDSTQQGTPESSATQPAPADSPAPAGSDAEPSAGAETAAPSDAGTADPASTAADTAADGVAAAQPDGSSATADAAAEPAAADTPEQVAAPVAVSGDVPDLELIDVATGDGVQLRSLLPADTPVLFWFWAPH